MDAGEIVVFLGPSLRVDEAQQILPARYLAPVQCGDVLRVRRLKPRVIAIIDGLFETTAAVWHKEILLAIEDGVAVFGASSMGALRAAELGSFGMIGLGKIFEAYRDGVYTDDDEVALLHGAAVHGYPAMSEAMVNIRATVARAIEEDVIGSEFGARIVQSAKDTFYQERSLNGAIDVARNGHTRHEESIRFRDFLDRGGYVNQKREDAVALVRHLAGTSVPPALPADGMRVHRSSYILKLAHDVMCRPFTAPDSGLPSEEQVALEVRSVDSVYRLLRMLAQLMSMVHALARARGLQVAPRDVSRVYDRDDFGLGPAARTRRWAETRDLDAAARTRFLERLNLIRALIEVSTPRRGRREERRRQQVTLLDFMRLDGRYPEWRPPGNGRGVTIDRVVLRNAECRDGLTFRLYRRIATLWDIVDEAMRRLEIEPFETSQFLSDEFRRARGLDRREAALAWLRANNLNRRDYARLVDRDARVDFLRRGSLTYALGLFDPVGSACWLLDAIRLSGFYPGLKRRAIRAQTGRPSSPLRA